MLLRFLTMALMGFALAWSVSLAPAAEPQGELVVPRQLQPKPDLQRKLSEALQRLASTNAAKLSSKTIDALPSLADLVLYSSSVENSSDRRYAVLYSMLSDLFTVLKFDDRGELSSVYFANGDILNTKIGRGRVPEDPDYALRAFKQRPKLQRDLVQLLVLDEKSTLADLTSLQGDDHSIKAAFLGLLMYIQVINDYAVSPCRETVERYRDSEAFAMRFEAGKRTTEHMLPRGLTKINDADTFILQDDEVGRQFALVEVDSAPSCKIKRTRIFFSY